MALTPCLKISGRLKLPAMAASLLMMAACSAGSYGQQGGFDHNAAAYGADYASAQYSSSRYGAGQYGGEINGQYIDQTNGQYNNQVGGCAVQGLRSDKRYKSRYGFSTPPCETGYWVHPTYQVETRQIETVQIQEPAPVITSPAPVIVQEDCPAGQYRTSFGDCAVMITEEAEPYVPPVTYTPPQAYPEPSVTPTYIPYRK